MKEKTKRTKKTPNAAPNAKITSHRPNAKKEISDGSQKELQRAMVDAVQDVEIEEPMQTTASWVIPARRLPYVRSVC